jgi:Mg-chelatase subunit ChlD
MKRNSRLRLYWLTLAFTVAVGCGKKEDSVSAELGEDDNPSSESDGNGNEGGGGGGSGRGRDAGTARMDAGDPDQHEIIEIEQPDATCAATSAEAPKVVVTKENVVETVTMTTKPVAIYLMLDRSSSMVGLCGNGPPCNAQSWNQATGAISAFLRDPASADLKVALGYFPPLTAYTDKSATSPLCMGTSCAAATVSVRRAADNAAVITDSLNAAVPSTDLLRTTYTPTECGLRGITSFCAAHRAANPGETCVGVLITDGAPTECNTNTAMLKAVAAASSADTRIFTLGMTGADFTFLDEIAAGGKTDCTPMGTATTPPVNACDVSSGQAAFIAALNAIRETVVMKESHIETHTETKEEPLECEWKLPEPPEEMKFEKDNVNVTFSATGKDPTTIGRVKSEEECTKHPEGWRYDSEDDPKKVLACPGACETIKTSPGAKISIEFGCKGKSLE